MSNVHHIHEDNIGLAQLVVELRKEKAKVDLANAVYREAILNLCNHADNLHSLALLLVDTFRYHDVEKMTDKGNELVDTYRQMAE